MAVKLSTLPDVLIPNITGRIRASLGGHPCTRLYIQAHPDNKGHVFVGDSLVSESRGLVLVAGERLMLSGEETGRNAASWYLADIWFMADKAPSTVKLAYVEVDG